MGIETSLMFLISITSLLGLSGIMNYNDEVKVKESYKTVRWFENKTKAKIIAAEQVTLPRRVITLTGQKFIEQNGYRVQLEHMNQYGKPTTTEHDFYDEFEQDAEFLSKYIKGDEVYIWIDNNDGSVYVPGEVRDDVSGTTIYGSDTVLIATLVTWLVLFLTCGMVTMAFSPASIIPYVIATVLAASIPQVVLYISELGTKIRKVKVLATGYVTHYAYYQGDDSAGIHKHMLVEQTLPVVMLPNGDGFLDYGVDTVDVLVNDDGSATFHVSKDYHMSSILRKLHDTKNSNHAEYVEKPEQKEKNN